MQKNLQEKLAILTVPCQEWGEVYEAEQAFCKGTIFPVLNKPFYVTEGGVQAPVHGDACKKADIIQEEREQLLNSINQVSFFWMI